MMKQVYSSPFRVYLFVGLFAVLGIVMGFQLPISLFPNSTKPLIATRLQYGSMSASEFLYQYGSRLESEFDSILESDLQIEQIEARYNTNDVLYKIQFKWGVDPQKALQRIKDIMNSMSSQWPLETRNNYWVNYWGNNSGFLALSFYSHERSTNEVYDILDPVLSPLLQKVPDADNPVLWNPGEQVVKVELDSQLLAQLGLMPTQIENIILDGLNAMKGGNITLGQSILPVELPRKINSIEDFNNLLVPVNNHYIPLSRIAHIGLQKNTQQQKIFKTNGSESLILFANPINGGNVKKMSEDIFKIIEQIMPNIPNDIKYRPLVDPSEFIRSSIQNVFHEVFLAAGMAVIVLFLFIGSLKNTITAAIEIPLSMVLAFILMKLTGMNINLISLGGLALSAGMNVDASVVVMENIFRHLETVKGKLNFQDKLNIISQAVSEVQLPVIASTIASLVVFLPLAFTSDLTNAILGDLAKAVVFSHGFSMFVALFLVPTIRLQLITSKSNKSDFKQEDKSPIEHQIKWLEKRYLELLEFFISHSKVKWSMISVLGLGLVILPFLIVPQLKKEVIGTADTDWIMLGLNTSTNTTIAQMDHLITKQEDIVLKHLNDSILYTFTQIRGANQGHIMLRLKDKSKMNDIWKDLENQFQDTPSIKYWVAPWNPSELPIPDPQLLKIVISGNSPEERQLATTLLLKKLYDKDYYPRTWSDPSDERQEQVVYTPIQERFVALGQAGIGLYPESLTEMTRILSEGKILTKRLNFGNKDYEILLQYKEQGQTIEGLQSIPVKVNDHYYPLKAFFHIKRTVKSPDILRINTQEQSIIYGDDKKGQEVDNPKTLALVSQIVKETQEQIKNDSRFKSLPIITMEDAQVDLNQALEQLAIAIGLSILLIFLTLIFQMGNIFHTAIVMTAIPTGVLGVLTSLFIFNSTISLNSALGVILLNGISVANSIIIVDFTRKLIQKGYHPEMAILLAAQKRMRPILITSLTTILGMLPIALGMGEGGKILQPLGISVAGGLWVSMIFTFFIVPLLLHLYYSTQKIPSLTEYKTHNHVHQKNDILTSKNLDKTHIPKVDA